MLHSLRTFVVAGVGVVTTLAALLAGGSPAAADPVVDPWTGCGPHSLEEKVVRVFPRTPVAGGPEGDSSALPCGNRYFGLRRIEAGWLAGATGEWRSLVDATVARALASGVTPVHDPRSGHWVYSTPEIEVALGPGGLVIDVRPPRRP